MEDDNRSPKTAGEFAAPQMFLVRRRAEAILMVALAACWNAGVLAFLLVIELANLHRLQAGNWTWMPPDSPLVLMLAAPLLLGLHIWCGVMWLFNELTAVLSIRITGGNELQLKGLLGTRMIEIEGISAIAFSRGGDDEGQLRYLQLRCGNRLIELPPFDGFYALVAALEARNALLPVVDRTPSGSWDT